MNPAILVLAGCVALLLSGCASTPPADLGLKGGRLQPCPSSPNCVSSQDENPERRMDPIVIESMPTRHALARLASLLLHRKRVRLTKSMSIAGTESFYLSAEFKSAIFGFVDDVEFLVDGEAKRIHFRSASRLGYSDLGANRRRMEELIEQFQAAK